MKPRACIAGLMLASAAIAAIPSCTNSAVSTYCVEMCDCENCNDEDLSACEASYGGEVDAAGEYDCEAEYIDLLECQADEGRCQNVGGKRHYILDNDCASEADDYADCVDDASDLAVDTVAASSGAATSSSTGSGGGAGNVAACNMFVDAVNCGTVDVSMYLNCDQYAAQPCDISGYFDCLTTNTKCENGILNNSGWAQCASLAQCN